MRAKLLSLLILGAAATAGAASAQAADSYSAPPTTLEKGPADSYAAVLTRELALGRAIDQPARSASATPRPVFAVVGRHLVSGELKPNERLMALVDPRQPTLSCTPSQRGAEIVLNCSNRSSAQLTLNNSGCGRSLSGEPASMCIGLAPKSAVRRLTAPAGKTLRIEGEQLVLEPVAGD